MKILPAIGTLLVLLAPTVTMAANAAALHHEVELLAFSRDGRSVILLERDNGVDGGSTVRFRLLGGKPLDASYPVGDSLSRGAGAHETIGAEACRETVEKLAKGIAERGFNGVTLKREACSGDRGDAVDVDDAAARTLDESWLGKANAVQSTLDGNKILLRHAGKTLDTIDLGTAPDAARAAISPGTRLLVVIAQMRDGSSSLAWIGASSSGRADSFRPLLPSP